MSDPQLSERPERWRRLPSVYGPYEVSDKGRVRNLEGLILKFETARSGHLRIRLYMVPGLSKKFQVHRLVARAFLGPGPLDVLHWDDNPSNNWVENLRYGNDRENWYDSVRNGIRRLSDSCPRGHTYPTGASGEPMRRCMLCENRKQVEVYVVRVSKGLEEKDPRHFSYAGYRAGCRNPCCLEANSRYKRDYYLRKKRATHVK